MAIRRSCALTVFLVTSTLSGCFGGNAGTEVRSAEYEAYCVTCHNLNGSPSFMGPIGVQIGPNTCKKVSCSNLAELTQYIELNMPPRSSVCTGECAESTAQFIVANFQTSSAGAAALNTKDILSALSKLSASDMNAYDQSTGEPVDLMEWLPTDAETSNTE